MFSRFRYPIGIVAFIVAGLIAYDRSSEVLEMLDKRLGSKQDQAGE